MQSSKPKKRRRLSPGGGGGGCWLGGPMTDSSHKYRKVGRGAFAPPNGEYEYPTEALQSGAGTSIFDPVLCELVYKWFCPAGGKVLDPFAGGSVRGIVAAKLGYGYTGVELREEQVEANIKQAKAIGVNPKWIVGDSARISSLVKGKYDIVFSCPPYYDLEVYSDAAGELSAMPTYDDFLVAYRKIISASVSKLKDNRFSCFVVGDVRDKKGCYRNFVGDTVAAFIEAGASLYNEAILVTAVGSLPIRVGKQFNSGRKLGKTHQNILVFYKGNPKCIKTEFGEVVNADDLVGGDHETEQ